MPLVQVDEVVNVLNNVANYNKQIVTEFQKVKVFASLNSDGFSTTSYFVERSHVVLAQLLTLLNKQAKDVQNGRKQALFSNTGLQYSLLLGQELGVSLAKISSMVADACLTNEERRAKEKQNRKAANKARFEKSKPEKGVCDLKLDEKVFTENAENAQWSWLMRVHFSDIVRLCKLQHHVALIVQVVKVEELSNDMSSGKLDITSIVKHHERISEYADLMELDRGAANIHRSRESRRYYSSGSSSGSGTDSEDDLSIRVKRKVLPLEGKTLDAPTSPSVGAPKVAKPLGLVADPKLLGPVKNADAPKMTTVNPPAYSENRSTTVSSAYSSAVPAVISNLDQLSEAPRASSHVSEKSTAANICAHVDGDTKSQASNIVEPVKATVPDIQCLRSTTSSIGFKIRTYFKRKESLAAEMAKVLNDTQASLKAYVIQESSSRLVPHSVFHSLESTHKRTILSQLNDNAWYKTFTKLNNQEHDALMEILLPASSGPAQQRELIVLKVIDNKKLEDWKAVLEIVLRISSYPCVTKRTILAITRQKMTPATTTETELGNEFECPTFAQPYSSRTVPALLTTRVAFPPPAPVPALLSFSDLRTPPPIPYRGGAIPPHVPAPSLPIGGRPGLPPPATHPLSPSMASANRPRNDYEALISMTTYYQFTVRRAAPTESWAGVNIAHRIVCAETIRQRLHTFLPITELSYSLTLDQRAHINRIRDFANGGETDTRFGWQWVETELYNDIGPLRDWRSDRSTTGAATYMQLVIKRSPLPYFRTLELYNQLVYSQAPRQAPPPPPPGWRPPPPPPANKFPPPPPRASIPLRPRYDSDSDSISSARPRGAGRVTGRFQSEMRRLQRKRQRQNRYSDSEDSDSEDEDPIDIDLKLKQGRDVVAALLELWTPGKAGAGKDAEELSG